MASITKTGSSDQHDLVTTIVVNWNGRAFLDQCLSSLVAQTYQPHEIILVDNASTDGSADDVEAKWPSIKVLRSQTNLGFAAGNNLAIQHSTGNYVALLNNDAYAEPDWLAKMIEVADQHESVGMIACKVLFADTPNMINSTGIALDWAGFCWDWQGGQIDDPTKIKIEERFGPTGGAALYRRVLLTEIGLFDEDFFAYAEDADLAWRAQRSGWQCLYVPQARVYHAASATSGEGSKFKSYLLSRSKVWLFAKNIPGGRYLGWLVLLTIYDLIAVVYGLIARGDWAALKGRAAGWRGLPGMLRKRSRLKTRTNDYLRLVQPLEPPWKIPARFHHLQTRHF